MSPLNFYVACLIQFYTAFYNSWNVTERKIKAGIHTKQEKQKCGGVQRRSFVKVGWGIREMFQWKKFTKLFRQK